MRSEDESIDTADEIERLEVRARDAMAEIYSKLNPWQKTQVARHPQRPHFKDYACGAVHGVHAAGRRPQIRRMMKRSRPVSPGFAAQPVAVIGQEKGSDTKSRIKHNFGSARPEGYRKAIRVMEMADRFGLPLITLIDTAGAYPGIGAEERGQAEAIARSTEMCLNVRVPIISVVLGEGGSGGAIAIATGNRVYMLEHAIYSVISPEGAASILWRDSTRAKEAATNMKITAEDLKSLGVIDGIIAEPVGGAHRDPQAVIESTGTIIADTLKELSARTGDQLRSDRRQKYLSIGRQL